MGSAQMFCISPVILLLSLAWSCLLLEDFNCTLKRMGCKCSPENINEIRWMYINRMVCIKSLGL